MLKMRKPRKRGFHAPDRPAPCHRRAARWKNGIAPPRISAGCPNTSDHRPAISGRSPGISTSRPGYPARTGCVDLPELFSRKCLASTVRGDRPSARIGTPLNDQAAMSCFSFRSPRSKTMAPLRTTTCITSFGPKRPSSIAFASGFSISDCMARLSGRAPYCSS